MSGADGKKVKDVENFIQRERLKSILDARQNVLEIVNHVEELRHTQPNFPHQSGNSMIRRAVENYILELKGIIIGHDRGKEYWSEKKIGEITIRPPNPIQMAWDHKVRSMPDNWKPQNQDTSHMPPSYTFKSEKSMETEVYELEGLKSLLEVPNPIEVPFTAVFDTPSGISDITYTKTRQLTQDELMSYFSIATTFARSCGLDAGFGGGKGSDVPSTVPEHIKKEAPRFQDE